MTVMEHEFIQRLNEALHIKQPFPWKIIDALTICATSRIAIGVMLQIAAHLTMA